MLDECWGREVKEISSVLDEYREKLKKEESINLYDLWNECPIIGSVTFCAHENNEWSVDIDFYQSYEKIDNDEEYLRRLSFYKEENKYKVDVSEYDFDNIIETKIMDFDEIKDFIMEKYNEVKDEIIDK